MTLKSNVTEGNDGAVLTGT